MDQGYMHQRGTDRVLKDMWRVEGETTYTWCDGLSGREIVRLTQSQVDACRHQGACDADVAAHVDSVLWLGDADTIRRTLKEYGAWDADELADDEQNRHRALWLAAADCQENPDTYRD
jgi:hypothetical protein